MYLGGLDVGTTGCKLTVYNEKGEFLFKAYEEYEASRTEGEHEIDAEEIFRGVKSVIRQAAKDYPIDAMGVTTFGETFVMLDAEDKVLLPAMLYTDPRGEAQCRALCVSFGEEALINICGVKPHAMYSLPKVMWIRENRPEIYGKAKRVLLMADYIVYMLSGQAKIDYSLAARTMALDIRKKEWSQEIFAAAGLPCELFSQVVPTGSIAGNIRPELCEDLGLSPNTKIVVGTHDQVASALGAGVMEVGHAVDGTGTVECITPVFDTIPTDKALYDEGYCVVPYVFPGTYVCYAFSFTGGAVIKWYRDMLSQEKSYQKLDASVPEGPTDLLVLPHFAGAATPYMDNGSKACILGLTLAHTGADIYKALLEGVTYEMMMNLSRLERGGISPTALYATGGGAMSDVWLQIKADILNRPIISMSAKEVGACGTCMLVGVAVGLFPDLAKAKEVFVKENKVYRPDENRAKQYEGRYRAYEKLYDAVRPVVEAMKE